MSKTESIPGSEVLVKEGVNLSYTAQELLHQGKEQLAGVVADLATEKLDAARRALAVPRDHKNQQ